jgi:hypothetical protein
MLFRKERQAVTEAARNVRPLVAFVVVALLFSVAAIFIALAAN